MIRFKFIKGFSHPETIWRVLIMVGHDDSHERLLFCWVDEFDHHRELIYLTVENVILGEYLNQYFDSGIKFVISEINVLDEGRHPTLLGRDFRDSWDKLVDITYAAYIEEN